jgi:predicted Kef-type K+ transport protein
VAFVVVWALLVAPRSTRSPLDQRTRMLVGSALLLAVAAVAIFGGRPALGGVFAALVLANTAALRATQPEGIPLTRRGE